MGGATIVRRTAGSVLACLAFATPARAATEREGVPLRLTAYMVWASRAETSKDIPKELKPLAESLRKALGGGSFRLHGKPFSGALAPGKILSLGLPQGYETRWSLAGESSGETGIRQTLVNPRKVETVDHLKKSPAITHLGRIRQGDETFLLVVTFGKPRKDDAKKGS